MTSPQTPTPPPPAAAGSEVCVSAPLEADAERAPRLGELAAAAGVSPASLRRDFLGCARRHTEAVRRPAPGRATARRAPRGRRRHRRDVRRGLRVEQPAVRARRFSARHDARVVRRAGQGRAHHVHDLRLAFGACSSRRPSAGSAGSSTAPTTTGLERVLCDEFAAADVARDDDLLAEVVVGGAAPDRRAGPGPRAAARHAGHRVPAPRVAGAAPHPARRDAVATARWPRRSARRAPRRGPSAPRAAGTRWCSSCRATG